MDSWVPSSTISDRDTRINFHFWKALKNWLGTKVKLSTAFHPQTDGQAECTIKTIEDIMRECVIDFKGDLYDHLPLIEFAYTNSYHSSISMDILEAIYGRRFRSLVWWFEV